MTRAALYLRQSLDRENSEEGIRRQRAACASLAELRGWAVVGEYVDNDVSASKPRGPGTAWHRLVNADASTRPDVILAVDLDRLLRTQRDLVTLIDLGIKVVTVDGEVDLATADGEFRATMTTALARFETRRKSERQRRANAHRRLEGRLPAGSKRAFGYTPLMRGAGVVTATRVGADGLSYPAYGHEPLEPEATAVRDGFALLLAGDSVRSIMREWNGRGLTTTTGAPWTAQSVRGVLVNPRYAGLIAPPRLVGAVSQQQHHVGLGDLEAGSWEPLVSPETWAAVRDLLADPARRSNPGRAPKWLLSGIATCGVCGAPMKGGQVRGIQAYRCSATPHLARKRDDADHLIVERIIHRLSQPDAADLLTAQDAPDVDRLRGELREVQEGERNVVSMVARGLTSMRAAEATLRDVRRRIADLEARLSDAGRVDVLGSLVSADDVRATWEALGGDRQRAVVRAMLTIEMHSPGKGSRAPRDPGGRLAHTAATMRLAWL
ncbi:MULTISPECIES: recombinase family protein [unclassified Agrococcus]|uniref:recombinase family protein n=1 Tax=unclassified Agrococcus TaxID=2615065 RepID=UPI0036199CCF